MSKDRVVEIEVLRSLAFLSIVFQHVLGGFLYLAYPGFGEIYLQYLLLALSRFAIPAFVIISGFASFYGDNASSSVGQYLQRLKKIIVPYVFWSVFFSIFNILLNTEFTGSLAQITAKILSSLLKGNAMYHLWFMVLILQFSLLNPVIRLIVNRLGKVRINPAIVFPVLIICQTGLMWLYQSYLPLLCSEEGNTLLDALIKYRDRIFVFWLFYYVIGIFAAKNYSGLGKLLHKYKLAILAGYIIVFSYIAFEGVRYTSYNAASGYSIYSIATSPVYPEMVICLLLETSLLFLVSKKITEKLKVMKKYLCIIADNSYRGYLLHPVFIKCFNALAKNLFSPQTYLLAIPVSFLLTAVSTVLVAILLGKIKPLRKITG